MTKMRFKRHIAKVNPPLLSHHNLGISRLNKKVGWNRRNVGNFCQLEGRANQRRIISKKISFHCISYRQGGGVDPRNPPPYPGVRHCNQRLTQILIKEWGRSPQPPMEFYTIFTQKTLIFARFLIEKGLTGISKRMRSLWTIRNTKMNQ